MRILTVVDYDEMWPTLFENERTLLQMTLGKVISRIHHIGSTSVPGLSAKPVIDILIEVANFESSDRCGKTVARTYLFGQRRRTSQFSYYNMSAHNVYYVKSPIEGIYATYRIHSSVSLLFT
ncbi:GrpB family protein [Klebsiella pneumoniae]